MICSRSGAILAARSKLKTAETCRRGVVAYLGRGPAAHHEVVALVHANAFDHASEVLAYVHQVVFGVERCLRCEAECASGLAVRVLANLLRRVAGCGRLPLANVREQDAAGPQPRAKGGESAATLAIRVRSLRTPRQRTAAATSGGSQPRKSAQTNAAPLVRSRACSISAVLRSTPMTRNPRAASAPA